MYGYIPDVGRTKLFFVMFVLSFLQVVAKVFSTALLAQTNSKWLMIWMAVDIGLFLLYKQARNDLIYYVPLSGWVKYVMAFSERSVMKVVSDFSGVLFLRGPYGKHSIFNTKPRSNIPFKNPSKKL